MQKSSWIRSNLRAVPVSTLITVYQFILAGWEPTSYPLRLTQRTLMLWECVLPPCQARQWETRSTSDVIRPPRVDFHFTAPTMTLKGTPSCK